MQGLCQNMTIGYIRDKILKNKKLEIGYIEEKSVQDMRKYREMRNFSAFDNELYFEDTKISYSDTEKEVYELSREAG